ncbi:MAG: ATP-binding cassette domain-containing protein [Treponema sp.]|nr:ATP-binding cassette domain-containing protein [Treponema sp.]
MAYFDTMNEPVRFTCPGDAIAAGLGMVHQQYMLVPNMTVLENVALGFRRAWNPVKLDYGLVRSRIEEITERYSLPVDPAAYVWQLSVGEQQRVELVKTLCLRARFLILDEPTSALTPQETDDLIALLRRMSSELSIIFISHKLNEVKNLCDKVTILRRGEVVFHGNTADHSRRPFPPGHCRPYDGPCGGTAKARRRCRRGRGNCPGHTGPFGEKRPGLSRA